VPLRVLVATHYWRPHRGGIETVAREQALRLLRRGHQVTVVTSRLGEDRAREDDQGLRLIRLRAANPLEARGVPYPLFSPALLPKALSLLRAHDVALVHSHTFLPSVVLAAAGRALGKPVLVLQHNTYVEYPQPLRGLEDLADATLGALTLRLARRRLAVSEETRRYVQRLASGPCELLRNGVDTARFQPAAPGERASLRKSLGLPDDRFVALTVRRLSFKNGIDTLLEAAALLPSVHFAIAGGGPDRAFLDRAVEERALTNVQALGFVPDESLPALYRAADLFVLPSKSGEGMPMVVLEAFASGLPCVATRTGGQVEIVQEGLTGFLVAPGEPAELACAVRDAAADPAALQRLGLAARASAALVDWDAQVSLLERLLLEAA